MVFRVFYGEPVPEARELEGGHVAHGEPMNPMTGEPEDTDVGFPGPEHHVAERALADEGRDGAARVLALVGGVVAIPGVTDMLEKFLEPTFEGSRYADTARATGAEWVGLAAGGVISIAASPLAGTSTRAPARHHARAPRPLPGLHAFLVNKWYFDELYDARVRPAHGRPSAASAGA